MKKRKITTILFDADNTLIDLNLSVGKALEWLFYNLSEDLMDEHLHDFLELDDTLWKQSEDLNSGIKKEDVPIVRFELFFRKHNIAFNDYIQANEWFKEGLATAVYPLKDSDYIIHKLYEQAYTICVVTNGIISLQKPRIMNTSFGKYIKRIIVSEEVGANKPDPLIFEYLIREMNIKVDEVIMVGDSLFNDIKGAQNANIKAVWFNPNHKKNLTNIIPDYEINSISEVLNLVERLNNENL